MTHRLLDLLNFCSKAKVVKNMTDGKRLTDIEALNYYGGSYMVECISYNSVKGEIIVKGAKL